MIIPIPCKLGDNFITKEGLKILKHVTWFKWSHGMEYTYFYENTGKWETSYFENYVNPEYDCACEIKDILLEDRFLKDRGYPLKGRGYAAGYEIIDGELYVELILTDKYFAHIYVQCNKNGEYVENGKIYVPPSWDTEEKQKSILLAQYNNTFVSCIKW
jgi:hypothetical protein